MSIYLTQDEADRLIKCEKRAVNNVRWEYPSLGGCVEVPLISPSSKERFLLDVNRKCKRLSRITYNARYLKVVMLLRLDIDATPHTNPDGTEIPPSHLHIYREGFDERWAFPVTASAFPNLTDPLGSLYDFLRYCNVTSPPNIQMRLLDER